MLEARFLTFPVVVSSAMVGLTGINSIQEMHRLVKPNGYFACIVGEIRSMDWCCKRFQEVISYFNQLSSAEMIFCEDLGSGYANEYDDEHYIYYLFRCN